MDIVNPAIVEYLVSLTPPRHPVLQEMEEYAREKQFPIIGPLVSRFLQQLVILTGATRVFEMGSGFGYSALWMSLVLPDGGQIHCTEFDPENIERGRKYHKTAGVANKIIWHQGDARESMREAKGEFDIILNDIDKEQYPQALAIAWPKLRRGGIMVTDNSLWSGAVITEETPRESTAGVLAVNRDTYGLSDAITTILPLRDGLLLAVKKKNLT
ncbi:MAG: O-methyltransferase [candidate division Zixibacteria bacterium]|nr:O-methyltransferase [candidate division Zixibacteria bacterium]